MLDEAEESPFKIMARHISEGERERLEKKKTSRAGSSSSALEIQCARCLWKRFARGDGEK